VAKHYHVQFSAKYADCDLISFLPYLSKDNS